MGYLTMFSWLSFFKIVIYLSVVDETPSSSAFILMILTATICSVPVMRPLQTLPQAPSPSLTRRSISLDTCIECENQLQRSLFSHSLQVWFDRLDLENIVKSRFINSAYLNQMKDRWKICIAATVISLALAILFLFLGFSFKTISLRQYGLLQYDFFKTVEQSQTVRTNGNYLVGIDYSFITYPKGLLSHKFNVEVLTKDKSIVKMEGLFIGQLIESEIVNLHFSYGPNEYYPIVARTVQQIFRESIQQFSLTEIISQRQSINSYVSSNVCLTIESKYSFMNCQYASTGLLTVNAAPIVLPPDISIQNYFKKILISTIDAQKKMNVYGNGGFNLIDDVQNLNAELFYNTTNLIVSTIGTYTQKSSQMFAGASYVLDNPLMPILSNQIYAFEWIK